MSYRKKTKLSKKSKRAIAWLIVLLIPPLFFVAILKGFGVNDNVFFPIILTLVGLEIIFLIIWNSPKMKGRRGEKKIARILARQAKRENGFVINDVIIPDSVNGKTSQIDHIYISKYTIACVETKNYSGRIYGNSKDREWTQVLNYGKVKNKLYNPEMQNATHVGRLSELLGIDHKLICNLVVFVKGNVDYIQADNVYTPRELKRYLKNRTEEIFYDKTIKNAYAKLVELKENPIQTTREHVKEIKQMQKDINNNICPRCGGELVVRTGKDGSKFLGCKNYPRCTFTKKL